MFTVRGNQEYNIRKQNQYIRPDVFGVQMPIPLAGIDTSLTPRDIKDSNVVNADNAYISSNGYLEMIGGYENFVSKTGDKTLMLTEFIINPSSKKMVWAYADGSSAKFGTISSSGVFTELLPDVTGTATAGGANTLTNSGATWTVNKYKGYKIKITAGTGIGQERIILSNTATIVTTTTNWTTNPDATSVYQITADLNVTDLIGYVPYINNRGAELLGTQTATGGSATTIVLSTATWTKDQWKGKIVKLTGGTGSGQFRQILSNDATTITVSGVDWETNPTAGTTFTIIELGNSLYFKQKGTNLYEYDGTNIYIYNDKPKGNALKIWQERLGIGGADDMVAQWSKPFTVTDFTGDGSFFGNIGSENGQLITAFYELPNKRLAIFKDDSYQIVNGIDGTVTAPVINAESISQAIGCCGVRAIAEIPNMGALIVSKDKNIYPFGYLKDVLSQVVGAENPISDKIKTLINIDNDEFANVFVNYDKINEIVWISFKEDDKTRVLLFDISRKSLIPFWYSSDMGIEEVINYDGETYMTLAGKAQVVKYTPKNYKRLGQNYSASVSFKDWSGSQTNPKSFERIIFNLKNTIGSFIAKARISDSSNIHQLATKIPMGNIDQVGGSGASASGFVPSGGNETVYDIENSQFVKRRFNLDYTNGISLQVEIESDDFFSIGEYTINGENYSEDEEDIDIQY